MDGQEVVPPQISDRPFDPAREPATPVAEAIVQDVLNQLQNFERHTKKRQRARRPSDQTVFIRTVSAVISDLIHRELTVPGGWVAIPLSKRNLGGANRARAVALNETLPKTLGLLAAPEMAFVELKKGHRSPFGKGRQTVIRRGSRLLTRVEDHRVVLGDLKRDPKVLPLPLIVRAAKVAGRKGQRCEIPDTEVARRYRAEMDRINAWIGQADIACYLEREDGTEVTDEDRFMRRIFNNGSLECGGRLYGGFWQRLRKDQRFAEIQIDGQRIVALDFAQMAPRIAYGMLGSTPPTGDLYFIPPFESCRDGIKSVLNALLSSDRVPSRFPAGTRKGFPTGVKVIDVVRAISERHPALVPVLGKGACHAIFLKESEILVEILLRLIDMGVVALPIHDCLVVAHSEREMVREVMLQVFREKVGVEGEVMEEVGSRAFIGKLPMESLGSS